MQRFFYKIAVLGFLILIPGQAAGTSCSDCHTVHNSQDGSPMRFDGVSGAPLPLLLRADCIECHTGTNSALTIAFPKVNDTVAPTYVWGDAGVGNNVLAGGNFYYVGDNDSFGHNVLGISPSDATLGNFPPGGLVALSSQLQCAGANGCHGDTTTPGISAFDSLGGAHHINATGVDIDGTTVAKSYRFLKGVLGWEDDDWEFTSSKSDHNEYVGLDRNAANQKSNETISSFCSNCHDDFHNTLSGSGSVGIGSNGNFLSPWLRHPTDLDMVTVGGEYLAYNSYDTRVPVARVKLNLNDGKPGLVEAGEGIIMCLTCHRAHGSPNYASLRWNYRGWPGVDPLTRESGCQICHTSKN